MMRKTFNEASAFKRTRYDNDLDFVKDYHIPESGGAWGWAWIRIRKEKQEDVQRLTEVLRTDAAVLPRHKCWVICDNDVNIRDGFAREWVLSFRLRPAEDIAIQDQVASMPRDPSAACPGGIEKRGRGNLVSSRVIVDATCKWPYPPLSLPPKKLLHKVRDQWGKYGLPPLNRNISLEKRSE